MIDPTIAGVNNSHGALHQLMVGYWGTCLVYAAARLGLADRLAPGPRESAELAAAIGTDHELLRRLLRGLVAIDVLAEDADGRFSLTPAGAGLRTDTRGSLHAWAIFHGELAMRAWGQLPGVLGGGGSGFEIAFGVNFYEHTKRHPEDDAIWNQAMVDSARAWLDDGGLLAGYTWRAGQTVVDVGGGHGALLVGLLTRYDGLHGVLFDLPHVVAGAGPYLEAGRIADRCRVIGGDATEAIPEGGDVYVFARVLFNWDDDAVTRMLACCARVLRPNARVLAIETVLADGPGRDPAALIDLNNLVLLGGRARSEAQWKSLFAEAGLVLDRMTRVGPVWALLEGRLRPVT